MKVIIIGGVAGGASAAARLRRLDESAEIILFERGEFISFANCGLPYYIGGEIKDKSKLTLQTPESFNRRFNVDVRINSEVTAIDRKKKTVTVVSHGDEYKESYDKLILSMGAEPFIPNITGIKSDKVFTLRNIPDTYKIKGFIEKFKPSSVLIAGGGYIGVEMAENLKNNGLKVIFAEMSDQVIAPLDYDTACDVRNYIASKGVELRLNNALLKIEEKDGRLSAYLSDGAFEVDFIVLAIGVRAESAIAAECGIECNERGGIIVNKRMQTNDPDIYAVGDAVEITDFVTRQKAMIPLAGPANKQGRIAADNICGIGSEYKGTQGSSILKIFDMTVATTGINEKTAKRLNLNYEKSFTYSASHAGYYPGATNISIKTIFDKESGVIYGAQLIGFDGTDKRADVLATAIRAGMNAKDLTNLELCYAPPYSSAKDPVNMAGYVIENIVTGKVKIFHWDEIPDLKKRKDVILLDTRTTIEYSNGHIEGFINIPLDDLRNNLDKLDKTKKIYVHCQSGLRSYIACRILTGRGYDCYNLSGGYRLYNSIVRNGESNIKMNTETQRVDKVVASDTIKVDVSGLNCPQPITDITTALNKAKSGDIAEITATDTGLIKDIENICAREGHVLLESEQVKGVLRVKIEKK